MTEIRIRYPSDIVDWAEINKLMDSLRAFEDIETVYDLGRRAMDWTEFVIIISVVSHFAAEQFFGTLLKEAGKSTWNVTCDQLRKLYAKSKLAGTPITVYVEIEENSTEITFQLGTQSMEQLGNGLSILPKLLKELIGKMTVNQPSGVCSIRADSDATTGIFESAVGYDERKRPIYVYSFEKKTWTPVSH
jgi:hypothetical protein